MFKFKVDRDFNEELIAFPFFAMVTNSFHVMDVVACYFTALLTVATKFSVLSQPDLLTALWSQHGPLYVPFETFHLK